jgi:AcrR family transcriptional regulator
MVRTARFSEDSFIDAAIALVAEGGPGAATMHAIARRVGAPTGSIYHRFESRSAILGIAWNTAYASLLGVLGPLLHAGRSLEAALAIVPWANEDDRRARFLLLNDPIALFEDAPPPAAIRERLELLEDEFDNAFRACVAAHTSAMISDEELARAKFLIFDGPIAVLRPHLLKESFLPPFVGQMIAELHTGMSIAVRQGGSLQPPSAAL